MHLIGKTINTKPSVSGTLYIKISFKLCSGIKKIQLKHDQVSKINK